MGRGHPPVHVPLEDTRIHRKGSMYDDKKTY